MQSAIPTPARAPLAAWYAIGILSLAVLYSIVDRQTLILLAPPLKSDLGLSDTQIGSLHGLGTALFATIAVIPLGWLADRMDRRLLLAACILVWSAAVAACGLATGYWSLLLFVAFLAAGEAGLSPIVYALIPDLFPERQRMTANFIYYTATILGGGVALAISGAVIDHIDLVSHWFPAEPFARETWRLAFFIVAVPGPLLAFAIGMIRLKPRAPRTSASSAAPLAKGEPGIGAYMASNWKAIAGLFVAFGLALLSQGTLFIWLPVVLMRQFALSQGAVGAGMGSAITIGSILGIASVAICTRFLQSRLGAVMPVRLPQYGYLILALLTPLYLIVESPTGILLIAGTQMAVFNGSNSLLPAVIQGLAPPHLRGRVFAISSAAITPFQMISPILVGLLSDRVFTQPGGLLLSLTMIGGPALVMAAATLRLAERHIMGTSEAVRALADQP